MINRMLVISTEGKEFVMNKEAEKMIRGRQVSLGSSFEVRQRRKKFNWKDLDCKEAEASMAERSELQRNGSDYDKKI